MGIFSTSEKIYVSTVTYPCGDDEDQATRTRFLKATVLNGVLQDRDLSRHITLAYLGGPGTRIRSAFRYARDHYTNGMPFGRFSYNVSPDVEDLTPILKAKHPGREVYYIQMMCTQTNFNFWAERYLTEQFGYDRETKTFSAPPRGIDADANVVYTIAQDGGINILLINTGGFTKSIIYRPVDMETHKLYLHCVYRTIDDQPAMTTTLTRNYESGDVDSHSVLITTEDRNQELYERRIDTYITTDYVTTDITFVEKTRLMSRPQYFMYRIGAGTYPVLDAILTDGSTTPSPFFPSLPLRINNKSFPEVYGDDYENHPLFKSMCKLTKKVGVSYPEIQLKLSQNEQISDIDYAFVSFGVSLNTKSPECKNYLFHFFDFMYEQQLYTKADFDAWAVDQVQVCLPYLKEPIDHVSVALVEEMFRVPIDDVNINLCEKFV